MKSHLHNLSLSSFIKLSALALLGVAVLFAPQLLANPGDLDSTLGNEGKVM